MRIRGTVAQVVWEALVLAFSCGVVPVWIASRMIGLVAGAPGA